MECLEARFPGMRLRMIDDHERIRQHIRIFVTLAKRLSVPVSKNDVVHLICALSGG